MSRVVETIGIDVGGTTIRAGVVAGDVVLDREERPTPASLTLLEDAIVDIVRVLRARRPAVRATGRRA